MEAVGIYIHIPFCNKKCYYCDFTSFSGKDDKIEDYIYYLIEELKIYKRIIKNRRIKSIFIGGGTPSSIDAKYIGRILEFINNNFNIEALEEVTIEVNPGTLDRKKVSIYRKVGINRISMGVQTFNEETLRKIGRIHDRRQVYNSYDLLREGGFENINLDFIFGLPDETIVDVKRNLDIIEKLKPSHISYYGLILEEDTHLYNLYKRGDLNIPSDKEEREMYYLIKERLNSMGYKHYEISNFSIEGKECKHNLLYWDIKEYIGLGLSSHSFLKGKRYWNRDNFKSYFSDLAGKELPVEGEETISLPIEISEFAIMGLRLIKGIDKREFKKRFHEHISYYYGDVIRKHIKNGLLEDEDDFIRLTSKGLDLSNKVEVDFLL